MFVFGWNCFSVEVIQLYHFIAVVCGVIEFYCYNLKCVGYTTVGLQNLKVNLRAGKKNCDMLKGQFTE